MWGLPRLSTIFLAAVSQPQSVREISNNFRQLYRILGEEAPVFQQATPTIRFNFVTPPPQGQAWSNQVFMMADSHLMSNDTNVLFHNVASQYGTEKPIALYLPGLDGFGISAATNQFDDLSRTFELWRMSISVDDRTSYRDLLRTVCQFIEQMSSTTNRPVYLIAESFGGLLAPAVSLQLQKKYEREGGKDTNPLKGLVLVNPATSFDESNWDTLAPALSLFGDLTSNIPMPLGLPSPYSVVGGLMLSTLIPNSEQNQRILQTILGLESLRQPQGAIENIQGVLESFQITAEVLPPGLLQHRIRNWMIVGSALINPRLSQLTVPTLVVVGTDDKLIASGNEVRRLSRTLPHCETLEVRGAGHFVLDDNVNLTEAMVYSKLLDPLKRTSKQKNKYSNTEGYDLILDWKPPSKELMQQVREESVKPLEDAFSPIFISTDENGNKVFGLDNLPKDGPLLFVSNHQLLGLDLNMVISAFYDNNLTVRGLAHPIVFQMPSTERIELEGRTPGLKKRRRGGAGPSTSNFELFGAVMVTPKNYYRLLESGQNALLFPGGVKEVFHRRDQAYQLLWPEKVDFVRTAAKFNATIIPLSAIGMADSLNILLNPDEIVSLPLLGERAMKFAKNVTAARFDTKNEDENFLPPIVAPGLPSRNYFLFGRPISTTEIDAKDRAACQSTYLRVQDEINHGFQELLNARQKDPYKDAPSRLAFERLTGKKAPTFALSDLARSKST